MRAAMELARRLGGAKPEFARTLFHELDESFAVHLLDRERKLLRVELADRLGDSQLCLAALEPFETAPLWLRNLLEARAECYSRTEPASRRAARAARDLADFLGAQPQPLAGR
jgi:hypothetical protein